MIKFRQFRKIKSCPVGTKKLKEKVITQKIILHLLRALFQEILIWCGMNQLIFVLIPPVVKVMLNFPLLIEIIVIIVIEMEKHPKEPSQLIPLLTHLVID